MKNKKNNNNKKKIKMTLLEAIERVVEMSKDSQMNAVFMEEASPEIGLLAESYGITERQAVLFCVCLEHGPYRVDYNDLALHLDMKKISVLSFASDIDALVRRRLLKYRDVKDEDDFDIPAPVIRCLKHNEVYELPRRTGLDCAELFELVGQMFEDVNDDAMTPQELCEELQSLFDDNKQIGFVYHLREYELDSEDEMIVTFFCHCLVNKDDDDIRFGQLEPLFHNKAHFNSMKCDLRSGGHELLWMKVLEYRCEDGIADNTRFKLTEKAMRNLLAEMKVCATDEKLADVIRAKDLTAKPMFYVEENQRQVDELLSFLVPEKYREIHERMQQKGFRTGFACLFYGSPGTGKTETVYQLARQTGRDIMVVDVPQIKSKWVGDSEKNIKAVFDRYRELVKKAEANANANTPILLFNEADAIIGIRMEGATNAVDKMENGIQNIILQEMEHLDGIMIATTNLTQNLDKAFERRFLYKIRFSKPTIEVRTHIWHTMIPDLVENDVRTLATKYDFSGGQIENIARHYTIDSILHGQNGDVLTRLIVHCDNERLEENTVRRIGF